MIARKLFRTTFANPASAVHLGLVGATAVFEAGRNWGANFAQP